MPRAFCASDSLIAADRVHRIYNGLDLAEFGRADFSSTPPLIIAVGRLIPKKGFGDLIRACALLAERGKLFRCEIIGEGPLENELRRQIDELCLQNNVVLTGAKPQTQLRGRLAAANVFVLPSVIDPDGGMDNLPTVIMEAMATGLPVVSTNIGGIPEMIIENETGFLVQSGDAAAMADAIQTCDLRSLFGGETWPIRLRTRGSAFLDRKECPRIVRAADIVATGLWPVDG